MQNENYTHKMAVYNAAMAQTIANRIMTFRGKEGAPLSFDILNRKQSELGSIGLFNKVFHGGKKIKGGRDTLTPPFVLHILKELFGNCLVKELHQIFINGLPVGFVMNFVAVTFIKVHIGFGMTACTQVCIHLL